MADEAVTCAGYQPSSETALPVADGGVGMAKGLSGGGQSSCSQPSC